MIEYRAEITEINIKFEKIFNATKVMNITDQIIEFFETTFKTNEVFEWLMFLKNKLIEVVYASNPSVINSTELSEQRKKFIQQNSDLDTVFEMT